MNLFAAHSDAHDEPGRDGRDRHSFVPRPYQVGARAAVRTCWSANGPQGTAPLVVAATGTGKTLTALYISQDTLLAGGRVVWLAHREELLSQPLADLHRHWPQIRGGIVQAARDDADAQLVFGSVLTLANEDRLRGILRHGPIALLVVDEAHHSLSPSHRAVIEALRGPDTLVLGLTATPDREDGKDLSELWEIAFTFGPSEAIAGGWLVPPWATVAKLDHLDEVIASVPVQGGDYDPGALGKALLLAGVVDWTVAQMRLVHEAERLPYRDDSADMSAKGRSVMVFAASVEQAEKTCDALRADGWDARFVHGGTPKNDRRRLLRTFKEGRIGVLVNVTALTEGTDLPIASCAVLARPFKSWSLFVQATGRVMRLHDPGWATRCPGEVCNALDPRYQGKRECFVLDLAGATALHSIVSAPVLIGGSRCSEAPDGLHDYQPTGKAKSNKGKCTHCGHTVACLPSMRMRGEGAHEWVDVPPSRLDPIERRCAHCTQPQCTKAANGRHVWVNLDAEQLTICVECDAEAPYRGDTLQSLVGKAGTVDSDVIWLRVPDVAPESWCADVDGQGLVFVVGDRGAGMWQPYWLRKGSHSARPLASQPVPHVEVRLRAADLLRRCRRMSGRGRPPSDAQRQYAVELGIDPKSFKDQAEASKEIVRAKGRKRLLELGLAKPVAGATR